MCVCVCVYVCMCVFVYVCLCVFMKISSLVRFSFHTLIIGRIEKSAFTSEPFQIFSQKFYRNVP